MIQFVNGAVAMGYAISGLCFLKFWRESHDRLFCLFACSFFILALNRAVPLFISQTDKDLSTYIVRLLGFSIIIAAIVDKNLRRD